jgi:glycosyltransferase involved in cell wall biosynthesis
MIEDGLVLRIGRAVERAAYKRADHIVVICDAFGRRINALGIPTTKISEIPDWVDVEAIRPLAPDAQIRMRLGAVPGEFLVVHAGNMGAKQDLLNVVAAASILMPQRLIKVALIGEGTERPDVVRAINDGNIKNVKVLPLQPAQEFPKILAAADVLLVNQARDVVDSVLPSKLLTYMASGRPVVAAAHTDSTTADLVRRSSCGLVTEPGRPETLADAIRSIATEPVSKLEEMGSRGRKYVEAHFERRSVLRQWDDLLSTLSNGSTRTK